MPSEIMRPCPFCGGEGMSQSVVADNGVEQFFIRCRSCGCEGPWFKTPGNAARYWNMRVIGKEDLMSSTTHRWRCIYCGELLEHIVSASKHFDECEKLKSKLATKKEKEDGKIGTTA